MIRDYLPASYPKVALVAPTAALLGRLNSLLRGSEWQTELYFEGSKAAKVLGTRVPDAIVWVRSHEQAQTTWQFMQGLSANPQLLAIPMLTISPDNLLALGSPEDGWATSQTPLVKALRALLPQDHPVA